VATMRGLTEDGWEQLGEIELGGTLVAGDPVSLLSPISSRTWYGAAVRPGRWHVLGRPWRKDRDQLEEISLVHHDHLRGFYDLYDEAAHTGSFELPRRRLVVLDGNLRVNEAILKEALTVEELQWVLDRGLVTAAIAEHPVQIIVPGGAQPGLIIFGLGPPPVQSAPTDPYSHEERDED
jgi:hypothetical protein